MSSFCGRVLPLSLWLNSAMSTWHCGLKDKSVIPRVSYLWIIYLTYIMTYFYVEKAHPNNLFLDSWCIVPEVKLYAYVLRLQLCEVLYASHFIDWTTLSAALLAGFDRYVFQPLWWLYKRSRSRSFEYTLQVQKTISGKVSLKLWIYYHTTSDKHY